MPCITCGSEDYESTYGGLLKCRQCGFVFADLTLSPAEYEALYGEDYFNGEEYLDYLRDRDVMERNFRRRLEYVKRFAPPSEFHTLLEVGCAYGLFLNLARQDFEVHGIDVAKEPTMFARESLHVDAITGDLAHCDAVDGPFDVVCLWDTIEHLPSLPAYFERLRELTHPGSMLFITSNDIASLNARIRKAKWRQVHPPTHLWYFAKSSIAKFLERYGFEMVDYRHVGFSRSLDLTFYSILKLKRKSDRLYRTVKHLGLTRGSFYLNLYDIFALAARRAG